jgi:hypothetical protein
MKKNSRIVDEAAAIEELKDISRNARLYLMDRIGNNLQAIHLCNDMGRSADVSRAADRLLVDMKKIGLFELYRTRGGEDSGTRGAV